MSKVSLIAAVDEAGGLGIRNKLLCHLPADLQRFKSMTLGKPIVMGRSTYESIGKPLSGRLNIVLSRTLSVIEGVTVLNSIDKVFETTHRHPEIMVIGGEQIYNQFIDMASRIYLTRIHHIFSADVFFPNVDHQVWCCKESFFLQQDQNNQFDMTFFTYERQS